MSNERNHEIARGVRVQKAPADMDRGELENALYDLAEFASHKLYESITLRRLIEARLK